MEWIRRVTRLLRSIFTTRNPWLRACVLFVAAAPVVFIMEFPAAQQSAFGRITTELTDVAFKLRADVVSGGDPVLFVDFDDRTIGKLAHSPFAQVQPTTPRALVADLLDFIRTAPPAQVPRVVVLDIDIGQVASDGDAGVARLQSALAAWATSPTTPPLIISRESYPAPILGVSAPGLALPNTPYDAIVAKAQNIYWSTDKAMADQNEEVREFLPYECVLKG